MRIDNEYDLGEKAFLITDEDQLERMVTAIIVKPGSLLYELSCGEDCSDHYGIEISKTRQVI
jgi:hypothetical protein